MILEGVRLKAELTEEQYERAIKLIEKLKSRFPNALVKKFKTQEKIGFIDVDLGVRLIILLEIVVSPHSCRNGREQVKIRLSDNDFQIMKFFLNELGVEYSPDFDGREVCDALKRKIKVRSLLDYLT